MEFLFEVEVFTHAIGCCILTLKGGAFIPLAAFVCAVVYLADILSTPCFPYYQGAVFTFELSYFSHTFYAFVLVCVYCCVIAFHTSTALGARYTRFVAVLVNGGAVGEVGVFTLYSLVVIGKNMATLKVRVTVPFEEREIAVPFREVNNEIVGRKEIIILQLLKPLLEYVESLGVDKERYIGVVVAYIGIELQVLDTFQFAACVETKVLHYVLLAILLYCSAYLLRCMAYQYRISRPRRDNTIMVEQRTLFGITNAFALLAVFATRSDNVCQRCAV